MKNVLLLNAGTRNVLVRDFKKTIDGKAKVIATDNYFLAPALYEADKYYITPWITVEGYWDIVEDICVREDIGLIISLIDPELVALAKEKERFNKRGILVNSSDLDVICSTYNKYETLSKIKNMNYPWIKTFCDIAEVKESVKEKKMSFPVFVKPQNGSGSVGIAKVNTMEELELYNRDGYVIQEYMEGQEVGADIYVDLISGEVVSIFLKKKLKMRSGETDKSVSFKDEKLFSMLKDFAVRFGLRGVNDIDVFEKNGDFYISEINPRFGGGYIHAYECGVDIPQMLINNMNGIENVNSIGEYDEGIYMMKYNDIRILKKEDAAENEI